MNAVIRKVLAAMVLLAALLAAWLWHVNYNDGVDIGGNGEAAAPAENQPSLIERGAYLATAGNCMACHTARGGEPWAGGRPFPTPFGTLYSSNLTPDQETGLGQWNAATFWRALHHGRSRDGRLLYPAFPYTHTTQIVREDSDALYAYLQSLSPVKAETPAHQLHWPYGTQAALAVWRALYFKPGTYQQDPAQSPEWNRGAYLVRGLTHCSACHAPRDKLAGANWQSLSGGLMPGQGWYAPSLVSGREAGMSDWSEHDIVRLLGTGYARNAGVSGPMAEVVSQSTQYLSKADLSAMATYLKELPQVETPPASPSSRGQRTGAFIAGEKIYENNCVACHGSQGQGIENAYPPLAGNRAVTLRQTENLVQMLLYGGFGASTGGHPRPFGMPPFVLALNDREIASVLSYIRNSWGNQAHEVSALEVHRIRAENAPR